LKQAAAFFDDGEPFLVHNADVLSTVDLGGLLRAHVRMRALATLAVMPRPTKRPLYFDSALRLVGRRMSDGRDELVRAPDGATEALGFCGIQAVSPVLFERMTETGAFGITETYLRLAGEGEAILAHRVDGAKWRDCGRPEDLRAL
jgi:NDP-sugar pyrophosphorylase family protein